MRNAAFILACAAALGAVGLYFGHVIHGPVSAALVPTLAGAAGGAGVGLAGLDVLRRWRAASRRVAAPEAGPN